MSTVIYLENGLNPHLRRVEQRSGSIAALAPDWQIPFVAFVDGQPVLRADWELVLEDEQSLAFIEVGAIPQGGKGGGGGSNPLRTILMIAVMVYAGPLAQGLVFGGGVQAAAALGGMGLAAFNAGAVFVGMSLVNAISPAPKPTSPQQAAALAAPSPTYSLQAQGNSARLDAAIPEHFGEHICYPDFAAQPYAEYAGNEQYLYQLLCIGRGSYTLGTLRIEDSPISSFDEITTQVVEPYGQMTLFPASVTTSVEVAGQTLSPSVVGPFVANASGTLANKLAFDFVAPRGLYYANDDGSLASRTVNFTIEVATVDAYGNLTSGWTVLASGLSYTAATTTAQRWSWSYDVAPGRYTARVSRSGTESTASREANGVVWAGLRAYHPDAAGKNYGDVTLLAVRMRASDNLSSQASRKINVIATRKLPIWNGSAWSAITATRNPAWALAYACKQVGLTDAQLDLAGLLTLANTCTNRADTFDARFDNFLSFWEAATKIAQSVRAKPYMQGGILRVVRDQSATLPVALFSQRNIVKGSLSINYLMPTEDTADSVDISYFDSITWAPAKVRSTLAGSTALKPAKVDIFGVTGRHQAWREGLYQAACNRYRRKIITFKTEMEGFIPSFGDLIAIQHDMPAWGQGGEVTAWNPGTRILTLSEPPVFTTGTHYIGLRTRAGGLQGPYVATAGANPHDIVLDTTPDSTPYTGTDEERTHYAFGPGITWRQPARVLSAKPQNLHLVEIEAVNEDDSVHTAETGVTMPAQVFSQLSAYQNAPMVTGVAANPAPFAPAKLLISWQPSPWATHYLVEQSSDAVAWVRCADVTGNNLITQNLFGNGTLVRVAAVGFSRGPWVQINITPSPVPEAVSNLSIDGHKLLWPAVSDQDISGYRIKYQYGANTEWATATLLYDGLVTSSPYTMQVVPPGRVTMMVRAVDSEGQESATSAYIITDMGEPLVANVLESYDFKAAAWPGDISGGAEVGGNLQALQGDAFYKADIASFYLADSLPFYSDTYDAFAWTSAGWSPSSVAAGYAAVASWQVQGDAITVQYRQTGPSQYYGNDDRYFYGADADAFFELPGPWQTWPGSIVTRAEEYQWRVATAAGPVAGLLSEFRLDVDVPDKELRLGDVALAAPGTRLAGAVGLFHSIQNVQLTLHGGSTAKLLEIQDKSTTLGPLVIARNGAGTGVTATIDALLQGY
ncbi:MAG: host specificity factor TipJ family phage tail protein [Rhodoferax sp.]|uniref:host specificity factor TipJ family phage tail protein n=1 Tax=Rhodoferax sp. TaxID=50421 RepID=UPI0027319D0A|nr:host specificity factor TipJ family phage tail protein [Rhodoferax sp.]MDP1530308.1 host specificity factor TipJ family phage tail protein [Rhodoferax sp.]MDP1943345.1 host specificity factor TipJ family phage tail protein [Rhodoferax sp.]